MGSNSKRNSSNPSPPSVSNAPKISSSTGEQTSATSTYRGPSKANKHPPAPTKTIPNSTEAPSKDKSAHAVISIDNKQPIQLPSSFTYHHTKSNKCEDLSSSSDKPNSAKKPKVDPNDTKNDEDFDMSSSLKELDESLERQAIQLEAELAANSKVNRTTAQSITKTNIDEKLPAIKLFISARVVDKFKSPVALAKEIDRCMSGKQKIKFASLKGTLLIIATDDNPTYSKLSGDWPADAFIHGIKPFIKQLKDTPRQITVLGVDLNTDLSDEYVRIQLSEQQLTNPARTINKKTGKATTFVKMQAASTSAYKKALKEGVRIGYFSYRVEPVSKTLQCFKCQETGHSAWHCAKDQVCLKCSGNHKHTECSVSELKCVNCGENHAACSRQCKHLSNPKQPTSTYIANANKNYKSTNPNSRSTFAETVKSKNSKQIDSSSAPKSPSINDQVKSLIEKMFDEKIAELMAAISSQISSLFSIHFGNNSSATTKSFAPQLSNLAANVSAQIAQIQPAILQTAKSTIANANQKNKTNV